MSNPLYPPKNRQAEHLPMLEIAIADLYGVKRYTPNSIAMAVAMGDLGAKPISGCKSDISGKLAVLYCVDDLKVALTPAELERLVRHALRPKEFFALRDKYGDAHDWHDDFYHPETGRAFQPIRK
jgi:hypothetical protein